MKGVTHAKRLARKLTAQSSAFSKWNRWLWELRKLSGIGFYDVPMVRPMAITYAVDVAPHLRRALELRARRSERWKQLHEHEGRAEFWQMAIPGCLLFWALVAYGIRSFF